MNVWSPDLVSNFLKRKFENYSRYSLIKWYHFFSMSNTSFRFTLHHARVSCLIIRLTRNATTVITVKRQRWILLIYALHNFLLRNNVTFFQKQPPLFLKVPNSTGKKLCWSLFFPLRWWNYIKTFVLHR